MKIIGSVCAAVVAICASASSFAATVADGGFEAPLVPDSSYQTFAAGSGLGDWSVVGGDVYLVNTNYHGFTAEEGLQWLSLSSATGAGVEQTIATDPGGLYTLSFWSGNALGPNVLGVTVGADTYQIANVPLLVGWNQYFIPFASVGDHTTIIFYNSALPDGRPGLDNVAISSRGGVPEPTAWAMMLLGFAGVGAGMRRRASRPALAVG